MTQYYWAVRPIVDPPTGANTRIEKAESAWTACMLCFGRGLEGFEAKNLGTLRSAITSDAQRIAALNSREGWQPVKKYAIRRTSNGQTK